MSTTPQRPFIYARMSRDNELGIERQVALSRDKARRVGWPEPVEVLIDDGVSAWNPRKVRPAYRRLLDAVAAGECDGLVVYDLDRLHRQPRELEQFFEVVERAGLEHLATVSGDIDLASEDGRFHARMMGAVASKASADTSRRLKAQMDQAARMGKPHPGRRPFGYERDHVTVRECEAEAIRDVVRRVLAGESLRSLAREWNARGLRSSGGKQWTVGTLGSLLKRPRIAGLRLHRGEVIGQGAWPAIIDTGTRERLLAALASRHTQPNGRPPTNLLTGLLVCGRCDRPMHSSRRVGGSRRYACNPTTGTDHCGRVAITAEPLEHYVTEGMLARLASDRFSQARGKQSGAEDKLARLTDDLLSDERQLDELVQLWTDRRISARDWTIARKAIEDRMAATRREIERLSGSQVFANLPADAEGLRREWDQHDLEWRRAVLRDVFDRIVVQPARPGVHRFDPRRVEPAWRY